MKKSIVLMFLFVVSLTSYADTFPVSSPFANFEKTDKYEFVHLMKTKISTNAETYTWCVSVFCDGVQYATVCASAGTMAEAVTNAHTEANRVRELICGEVGN